MSVKQGNIDVTSQQIALLRREIEQLERTLSRLSGERVKLDEKPGNPEKEAYRSVTSGA